MVSSGLAARVPGVLKKATGRRSWQSGQSSQGLVSVLAPKEEFGVWEAEGPRWHCALVVPRDTQGTELQWE